jgi:hypothetical protein
MKKISFLLVVPALVTALTGCRKDPDAPAPPAGGGEIEMGHVRLRFVPEWEGQPFQPFVELQNISNYRVQIEKVQFYVSDLHFRSITRSSDTLEVMFLDLIDGPTDTLLRVPTGIWNDLKFGLGVSEELNYSDPTLYANDHPLSASNGMHWDWTLGYIFTKFEGRHDVTPGSSGPFPSTFSIHTGFDTAYVSVGLNSQLAMNVDRDDTLTVNVRVAIDEFFHSTNGGTIDLATEYMSHGTNVPLSLKLARNVANSFSVDPE